MENLRSKPFWDRSPLESLADGYKKLPRNFKLCMLATFIIGLAAHMYCYTALRHGLCARLCPSPLQQVLSLFPG